MIQTPTDFQRQLKDENDRLKGYLAAMTAERDAALQRAKEAEALNAKWPSEWVKELEDERNARLAAEAEAVAMRLALKAALADGDQESEKVWHGRLRHEVAVQCKHALDGSIARPLADFLARLRAAPCMRQQFLDGPGCTKLYTDKSLWCPTCQARSPNYGGTE